MRVNLLGGFYKAKSLIAGAQRCVNLYPEKNEDGAPFPYTYYLTPGLRKLISPGAPIMARGLYRASNGVLFAAIGGTLYTVGPSWALTSCGAINPGVSQVVMSDNRLVMLVVDGTQAGYYVDLTIAVPAAVPINSAGFYGADRVDYLDTFFVLNRPSTNQFYLSTSNITAAMLAGGPVVTGSVTAGGSGYTDGTHSNIALTGGSGSGATANIVVSGGAVTTTTIILPGEPYRVGDVLSASGLSLGGAITAGSIVAGGYFLTAAPYNNVPMSGGTGTGCTLNFVFNNGGITGTPEIASAGSGYVAGDTITTANANVGGTGAGLSVVVTVISAGGGVASVGVLNAGAGYTAALYTGVAITGGSGAGAIASVRVDFGAVTAVTVTSAGRDYRVGDQVTFPISSIGGTGGGPIWGITGAAQSGTGFGYRVATINQGSSAFVTTDIASKTSSSDSLQTLIVMKDEVWLLGERTSEVWGDDGAIDFPLQKIPGVLIEHGCIAKASVAKTDLSIFWLGQDKEGGVVAFEGAAYAAKRISTHAVEAAWQGYAVVEDAVGFTYQQDGHYFWQLTFPTADATWVYDLATGLWHERVWLDGNGVEHRHRANCYAWCNDTNIIGDWQNGTLYALDPKTYTDNGAPIVRRRGFQHMANDGDRVFYRRFVAEMEVGNAPGTDATTPPMLSLRWSDTRGASWGNPILIPAGAEGEYKRQIQAQRLGMGRDRVFELSWSYPYETALMGAYIDASKSAT